MTQRYGIKLLIGERSGVTAFLFFIDYLPISLKSIVMESICISEHLSDSRQHSLLDSPIGKINGRNHARFPRLGVIRNVLPDFPFLDDSPKSAKLLATDYLPHIGQFLLSEYFLVCCLHGVHLLWWELV